MQGLMQDWPLRVSRILDHASLYHGEREIVTRTVEGPMHRTTYAALHERALRCAAALAALGVGKGDVIGTLAWNTHRHLEAWYGITGAGGVYHTLNPRLFMEQLAYVAGHAGDRWILADTSFVEQLEQLEAACPTIEGFIFLTDRDHMPATKLRRALCYEDLIAAADPGFDWVDGDERDAAGLCYTSGTTGNPKGVLYSHRSNVLHSLAAGGADVLGLTSDTVIMPVVPLFHANAWSIAFSAPMAGAKIVMPGPRLDGESVYELLDTERVNFTAAVPTVWLMLLQYLESTGKELPYLERVIIGGSAVPRVMMETFEDRYGVQVIHAWGMTEMSPVGTVGVLKQGMDQLTRDEQLEIKLKQGRPMFSVEMKIVDDDGRELPRDGKAFGHLLVRGPAVAGGYMKGEGGEILDDEGYFRTGDVATIDPDGFMQITDRSKDVIKSGGEWISSIELENVALGCPGVAEAAVIGVAHPKWDERPLLIVVRSEGSEVTREDLLTFLQDKIAKWWMPDDVVFVDEIPHTATGKIQKLTLREQFSGYRLPGVAAD
jgi:fatty-acyl-CoA synthase